MVNNVCLGHFLTDRLRQGHAFQEQMAQGIGWKGEAADACFALDSLLSGGYNSCV